jgi:hypothetical protein
LLLPARAGGGAAPARRDVPARRQRPAQVDVNALAGESMRVQLFDDAILTLRRATLEQVADGRFVWTGNDEAGAQGVITVVDGVLTGTVFADHKVFEITVAPDGQYSVTELDSAAFPSDDPPVDAADVDAGEAPGADVEDALTAQGQESKTSAAAVGDVLNPTQIDVMIVWTPAAESAAGGRAAMNSLALAAVANANLVYTNSLVGARLRLVYAAPVTFTESPSNLSNDLTLLRGTSDGKIDQVHTLRTTYGADIVTLIGNGYAKNGYCGIGGLMSNVSTSFASYAFNVVDRTCAVGNLSYAHEVGHNQGLQHDPANAGSAPSYSYAYGYQSPTGLFRTLMSYGSALRIPMLSSPTLSYLGAVAGTSNQNNARALGNNATTIAAFKGTTSAAPPACTYAVSTTSLSFAVTGGTQTVSVTAPAGCTWTATKDAAASWVSLGTASGSGNGSVTLTATANTGGTRTGVATIAGRTVALSQAAATTSSCSYSLSDTALSFVASGGPQTVLVTAPTGCAWTVTKDAAASWVTLSKTSASGSGSVTLTATANTGGARTSTATIAGRSVALSQAGATTSTGVNVAAASAGARASASTSYYSAAGAINGDRRGASYSLGSGGWRDATPGSFPDWLQVTFASAKTISQVALFSVQDNSTAPVEPSSALTFSKYGVTAFSVQYLSGTTWVSVPGAVVTGNRNVWRTVTFSPITTAAIRIVVTGAMDGTSRIVEVEAR